MEALSRHAAFPLRQASTPGEHGCGVHYMGGAAWGFDYINGVFSRSQVLLPPGLTLYLK